MADNSTVVQQNKETKEKLPKKEVLKSPVQKEISKGLDWREADLNSDIERKKYGLEIEEGRAKEKPTKARDSKAPSGDSRHAF